MNKLLSLFLLLFCFQSIAQRIIYDSTSTILVVKGIYQGKNLYSTNPIDNAVKGTKCVDSIYINEKRFEPSMLNAAAFEVDLSNLQMQTPYKVIIYHKKFCQPKFMLMGWEGYTSTIVTFNTFSVTADGSMHIATETDTKGPRQNLQIEQFRGGMWNPLLSIPQKQGIKNTYDTVVKLYGGLNKFRVYQASRLILDVKTTIQSNIPTISYTIDSAKTYIRFSDTAYYSICDYNAIDNSSLFRGFDTNVDISYLKNGSYILFYENERILFNITQRKSTRND